MRRYFKTVFNGSEWVARGGSGPGESIYFWEIPDKFEWLEILNLAQNLNVSQGTQVPLDETFPTYNSDGDPIDYPGHIVNPGAFYIDSFYNSITDLLSWFKTTDKPPAPTANPETVDKAASDFGKRQEKQDFSGAGGLFLFLQNLPLLAADLRKKGQLRQSEIVLFAYNKVVTHQWSITTAFKYLLDNRILSIIS